MSLLKWNHKKVQNFTPREIWMFIIGRVLAGYGIGILAMQYFPRNVSWSGIPALVLGLIILMTGAKGLMRKAPLGG